jgi:DNA-binding HxlR family transcriptional regulator
VKKQSNNPYDALERLFHEPHRLAIMSALCRRGQGRSFKQLKKECGLTDGNLSRHLKTLEESGVVRIQKTFVGSRPHTSVFATDTGRDEFVRYLQALETVLNQAVESVTFEEAAAQTWRETTVSGVKEIPVQ